MKRILPIAFLTLVGCGTNTLIIKPGAPVMLSQDVTLHRPYLYDGKEFIRSANDWTGGAGWFLVPPPRPVTPTPAK